MFQVTVDLNTTLTRAQEVQVRVLRVIWTPRDQSAKFGTNLSVTGLQAYLLSDSRMARSAVWEGQLIAYLKDLPTSW